MDGASFLYEKIYRDLCEQIVSGQLVPGNRVPTEAELAARYQVSRITSKKALTLLAEKGLVIRRRGAGTFVAPQAPDDKIYTPLRDADDAPSPRRLGVLMEDLGESYSLSLFYELSRHIGEAGFQMCLGVSFGDQAKERVVLRHLLSQQIQGLLILPAHGAYYNTDLLRIVLNHFPVVLLDRPLHGIPAPSVTSDNTVGARKLTELLIGQGHQHIGFISTDFSEAISLENRRNGYLQALRSRNLADCPPLILPKLVRFESAAHLATAAPIAPAEQHTIAAWLQENPHITAVVGSEYGVAHLVQRAAAVIGRRVPQDLAICCFDERYGYLGEYQFTHIKQDEAALAKKAVEVLLSMLAGTNMRRQSHVVPTRLLVGGTT